MAYFKSTNDAIALLTEKAVRRIGREFVTSRNAGELPARRTLIVSLAIRDAQDRLEAETTAALPAQELHSSILLGCIASGLLIQRGPAIVEAA